MTHRPRLCASSLIALTCGAVEAGIRLEDVDVVANPFQRRGARFLRRPGVRGLVAAMPALDVLVGEVRDEPAGDLDPRRRHLSRFDLLLERGDVLRIGTKVERRRHAELAACPSRRSRKCLGCESGRCDARYW